MTCKLFFSQKAHYLLIIFLIYLAILMIINFNKLIDENETYFHSILEIDLIFSMNVLRRKYSGANLPS